MIKPTIGRVVWFQPSHAADAPERAQPHAALIAYVHGDRCINVGGFDGNGMPFSACSVILVQEGDAVPTGGYYASWMPFQVGQAKAASSVGTVGSQAPQSGGAESHASKVLYPAIEAAMKELDQLPEAFNFTVNRAFNILHEAFWSECPAPASAPQRGNLG